MPPKTVPPKKDSKAPPAKAPPAGKAPVTPPTGKAPVTPASKAPVVNPADEKIAQLEKELNEKHELHTTTKADMTLQFNSMKEDCEKQIEQLVRQNEEQKAQLQALLNDKNNQDELVKQLQKKVDTMQNAFSNMVKDALEKKGLRISNIE